MSGVYVLHLSLFVCTHAEDTHVMENTDAPTAGRASSSGQNMSNVILGFFVNPFLCSCLYSLFFSDHSVGLCFFQDKQKRVKVVYAHGGNKKRMRMAKIR
jgi:hypothetical protein